MTTRTERRTSRPTRGSIVAVTITFLAACAKDDAESETSWTLNAAECTLATTNATIGGRPAQWTGCRARYDAASRVFTLQLLRSGTTGSFAAPGIGWLSISVHLLSDEYTTLPVRFAGADSPAVVPVNTVSITYRNDRGERVIGSGTLDVSANSINPYEAWFQMGGSLNGLSLGAEGAGGSFRAEIGAAPPPSSGSPPAAGSGSCSNACTALTQQCQNGASRGLLGPCYCAAACVCRACGNPSCERENRESAAAIGASCAY